MNKINLASDTRRQAKFTSSVFPSKWLSSSEFSSVQFSGSVVSDSLQPHGLQHAKPPCPSPTSITESILKLPPPQGGFQLVCPKEKDLGCH